MSLSLLVRSNDDLSSDAPPPTQCGPAACLRCLGIPELLDVILRDVYGQGDGRGSIASFAVTSKEFHAGAIAVLWEEMETLVPLLNLIPPDVWNYVRKDEDPALAWLRLPHPRDRIMRSLEWYGQHIKRITWDQDQGNDMYILQESTIGLLAYLPSTIQLLPNVRSFEWTEHGPSAGLTLLNTRSFANSLLQELMLDMALTEENPVASVLDVVRRQCPKLNTLRLVGEADAPLDVAVSVALADLIRSVGLVEFSCTCPLFDEVLVAVAQSPSLKSVEVKADWCTLDNAVISVLPYAFPFVQDLTLRLEILDGSSLALLTKLKSDTLVNLSLHVTSEVYDDDLLIKHLVALTKAPFAETLRKIELHAWCMDSESDQDESNPCTVTLKTLQPLLRLRQLTHFSIYAKQFSLSSADIRTIAGAFPNVEALELMPTLVMGTEPSVEALQHLVELCPSLTLIVMPITVAFGVPTIRPGWKSSSRITVYTIVTAQDLSGDPQISAYISALFPASSSDEVYEASDITGEAKEQYVETEELKLEQTPSESAASARSHVDGWPKMLT
ncbi:hypothetical protein DAEQUDRAFT_769787 [Daedalea quercina L-15889]|uniref:F-box domain-containing protein n=1 Tax=Daedalea quercina L-15889 TaxID=1314783 RepID=A0A165LEU9_9APHY|nr:hypothetical protein DAEQUDRAFT_769787 [Daedalea quercina L-15889]